MGWPVSGCFVSAVLQAKRSTRHIKGNSSPPCLFVLFSSLSLAPRITRVVSPGLWLSIGSESMVISNKLELRLWSRSQQTTKFLLKIVHAQLQIWKLYCVKHFGISVYVCMCQEGVVTKEEACCFVDGVNTSQWGCSTNWQASYYCGEVLTVQGSPRSDTENLPRIHVEAERYKVTSLMFCFVMRFWSGRGVWGQQ